MNIPRTAPKLLLVACVFVAFGSQVYSQTNRRIASTSPKVIQVRKGETLETLAERHHVSPKDLAERNNLTAKSNLRKGQRLILPGVEPVKSRIDQGEIVGNRIQFADGRSFEVDEAWKQGEVIWYRRGGVTQSLEQEVKSIDPIYAKSTKSSDQSVSAVTAVSPQTQTWIYLVGGARFKVDQVSETDAGAWYNRGNLSVFVEKERIERIARLDPNSSSPASATTDWSTGNSSIDELIRVNGTRFGVDPYLVFCVIEHESHFHSRALSPKGAQGLMQLMPGTARRFGVTSPYDVGQNIRGGTRYLRELMDMFKGEINLVLASYNAGEGAVMKFGNRVPPYQETREYVRKIGKRYGLSGRQPNQDNQLVDPQR